MKILLIAITTLLTVNSFANVCKTKDLDQTVLVLLDLQEEEENSGSLFGIFIDIFDLLGCITAAESMNDLNMSRDNLVLFKNHMSLSFEDEITELNIRINLLEGSLQLETNPSKRAQLNKELSEIVEELNILIADYSYFMGKVDMLLASA